MSVTLDRIPTMVQGEGALAEIGPLAVALGGEGARVLLAADPGLKPSGMVDEALAVLRKAGAAPILFDDIKSDPTTRQCDAGAALARAEKASVVVALGGGSALDIGKAIAAIAPAGAPSETYALCASPFPAGTLAKICVPTTAGTGSETTRVSILTDGAGNKVWFWGDEIKAERVVLDPSLTVGLPAHLTAATGVDAWVHAVEAATNARHNPANDVYAHAAIRLVVRHLERCVSHPGDVAARAGLQLAAAFAGVAIDNAGTAIGHTIGHAMASLRPIHHGRAVGLAMLATLGWNVGEDDGSFAGVAEAMGEGADAARVPGAFERLLRGTGVKVSLAGEFDGVTPGQLHAQMLRPENASMLTANRRRPDDDQLRRFAETVLTQG
ncbi:MAG: iron-containing alcohol dehydrogenase [Alsobacter sp.]